MIGATLGGFISALISGGHLFESPYHFGMFLAFVIPMIIVGNILDAR